MMQFVRIARIFLVSALCLTWFAKVQVCAGVILTSVQNQHGSDASIPELLNDGILSSRRPIEIYGKISG